MTDISNDSGGLFSTLNLPRTLDLRAAAPLAADFGRFRGRPLAIDASEVEKVGAQCVQVLVSAQQTWARDGVALTLSNPSSAFLGALEILGIPTIGE
ncbi:STAS domain-containing protein [Methylocystis iwaonis]|uniref:Chemotaxis protein CheX n=1 Tax=Methylocystis iwaonis TaxID=2885079 RepID=A0ABN6VBN0_9HYPH|nr:STAS domain-containing protein [Methylocystis iwaonis]BDV33023.1 chemotaxis protein CheX [Methylocystis iwaonis]